ncbi:hypothetical protein AL035_17860 [Salipiger aestuarii]|uniref:Uncharacterized protein n=1 Tax=Salipiger aestuarii TaxID=568098 RepID=A0A327YSZ8_9RHOB|nr:hypothetical protein [Salipiger aestuarii]KAB2539673.1 hypothetical protein AL035_17860 [Salipiger aestuarii]RAK24090.1 hypothetical protein ATI53_1001197 [Salipiger aestuarii]
MEYGSKRLIILAEISRNPFRSAPEIAAAVNCSEMYVRSVASRRGVVYGRHLIEVAQSGNLVWLQREADRLGVSVPDLINLIVTDARLDAEEAA